MVAGPHRPKEPQDLHTTPYIWFGASLLWWHSIALAHLPNHSSVLEASGSASSLAGHGWLSRACFCPGPASQTEWEKSVAAVPWGACNTDGPPVNLDGPGLSPWTLHSPYWGINTEMAAGSLARAIWFCTPPIS